jgi:hypothetical protein
MAAFSFVRHVSLFHFFLLSAADIIIHSNVLTLMARRIARSAAVTRSKAKLY